MCGLLGFPPAENFSLREIPETPVRCVSLCKRRGYYINSYDDDERKYSALSKDAEVDSLIGRSSAVSEEAA